MRRCDVFVAGAGPAGSVCAALCANAGLDVVLADRAEFPRDKVCGDCLNPAVWPLLDHLGLRDGAEALPGAQAERIEFVSIGGRRVVVNAASRAPAERMVRRRVFDNLLLDRARRAGAEFVPGAAVRTIHSGWEVRTAAGDWRARWVVAADGRNSIIARHLGLLPRVSSDRVAMQTHLPDAGAFHNSVAMFFFAFGYGGAADVGDGLNLCLVASRGKIDELRSLADDRFGTGGAKWKSITPLDRPPAACVATDGLFLAGDAARIVEPFTGEGTYYAMRSGMLAAHAVCTSAKGFRCAEESYRRLHRAMFRGRLWINHLSRAAVSHPRLASWLLDRSGPNARWLEWLTRKVIRPPTTNL